MSKACECEHICHTVSDAYRSPNGNPGHSYGMAFVESSLQAIKTPYGTFQVCKDCASDCLAAYMQEAPNIKSFKPSSTKKFLCRGVQGWDRITVEIQDDSELGLRWRMTVNDKPSQISSYYEGVMIHEGYGLTTAFYEPSIKEFVPFKLVYGEPQ